MDGTTFNRSIANLQRTWKHSSAERDRLVDAAWATVFRLIPQPSLEASGRLSSSNSSIPPIQGNPGCAAMMERIPSLPNYEDWNQAFQKAGRIRRSSVTHPSGTIQKQHQTQFSHNLQGSNIHINHQARAAIEVKLGPPSTSNASGLNVAALKAATMTGHKPFPGIMKYDEEDIQNMTSASYPPKQHWNGSDAASKRGRFDGDESNNTVPSFVSAKQRFNSNRDDQQNNDEPVSLGTTRPFKPPTRLGEPPGGSGARQPRPTGNVGPPRPSRPLAKGPAAIKGPANNVKQQIQSLGKGLQEEPVGDEHPRLKGIDPDLIERIENEILEMGQPVSFDDIAGLDFAKQCIEEMVVWPVKNPEFYTGLRQLPKGLLLFGPPGTGKTVLGKAIAHECNATFFSISASSLTSKWIGEGEKLVRALFAVASARQPSVVFIDEIDSLLTQRSSDENEASRRLKTEFLVQFDGAATGQDDVVLIIGATNRPQELDEAARRRFVRRLYVPLPDAHTRCQLLTHLLKKNENSITPEEVEELGRLTEGYSGADVTNFAREASMGPLREVLRAGGPGGSGSTTQLKKTLRPICRKDFDVALRSVKASVSNMDLAMYEKWNNEFGTQQFVE